MPEDRKRKRVQVRSACETCRNRKTACNGGRPACASCLDRGLECIFRTIDAEETNTAALKRQYQDLRASVTSLNDIVTYLRDAPESAAHEALALLRQSLGSGPSTSTASGSVSGSYRSDRETPSAPVNTDESLRLLSAPKATGYLVSPAASDGLVHATNAGPEQSSSPDDSNAMPQPDSHWITDSNFFLVPQNFTFDPSALPVDIPSVLPQRQPPQHQEPGR